MRTTEYWSIGEVLSLLQDEFPEITISKIRFLESQGLIQPERTPSGYRRFYQGDFDLLQWILVQQRDHYLPLKVIRDRIEAGDLDPAILQSVEARDETRLPVAEPDIATGSNAVADQTGRDRAPTGADQSEPELGVVAASDESASIDPVPLAAEQAAPSELHGPEPENHEPEAHETGVHEPEAHEPEAHGVQGTGSNEPAPPLALTRDELADASGCSPKMVGDLERYRLVKGRKAGPTVLYDQTALLIARIAAQFDAYGLEPRHLRTFLIGAEREVGLVYQVVEPMLHRRDEETRRKAHETLDDLTDLAGSLRSVLMRQVAEELLPKH